MIIREASDQDFSKIWPTFQTIVRTGETYAIPSDIDEASAREIWLKAPLKTYVAEKDGVILGTYKLNENQSGGGKHVCNCGYMVTPEARGHGIASMMCEHSQTVAVELGFKAMQFNLVVSTNMGAVRLWQKLGFDIVGTLPGAFHHPQEGYVDAYVMYKWLAEQT
jgi:ribosomal protein S18 acetylase RimI-like enzyme